VNFERLVRPIQIELLASDFRRKTARGRLFRYVLKSPAPRSIALVPRFQNTHAAPFRIQVGAPRLGVTVWVLGFSAFSVFVRPEQRRSLPTRARCLRGFGK